MRGVSTASPQNVVRFTALLDIGQRRLKLVGGNAPPGATQVYAGSLLPGGAPFDLSAFADRILGALFNVTLPAGFPALPIDTLSGRIVLAPPPASSGYVFTATSSVVVDYPFQAVLPIPVAFHGFDITLSSDAGAPGQEVRLRTAVGSSSGALAGLGDVTGSLVLGNGSYAVAFCIAAPVSIARLLGTLLDCAIPPELAVFFPTFSPMSADAPLRVYYAHAAGGAQALPDGYVHGLHIDQCTVGILGLTFSFGLDWNGGAYRFRASVAPLDFGYFTLTAPAAPSSSGLGGPEIAVASAPLSITLGATLGFPSLTALALTLTAQTRDGAGQAFAGSILYEGEVLGVTNPQLDIAWSSEHGFQLGPFPETTQLASFIDFAAELQKMAPKTASGCKALTAFVFSKIVTTTFHFTANLASAGAASSSGTFAVKVGGTYEVVIAGQSICTVPFDPIPLPVTVPGSLDDLGKAMVTTLLQSAEALVRGLWNDQVAFFKLLAAQTALGISQAVVDQLICNAGGETLGKEVVDDTAGELVEAANSGGMETLLAAATVLAAATAALSFFASIWKCITGAQRRENAAMEARRDAATSRIQTLLALTGFSATYIYEDHKCWAYASWDKLNISDPNASLAATLSDLDGSNPYTFAVDIHAPTLKAPLPIAPGGQYQLTLCGSYLYNGSACPGLPVNAVVTVDILGPTLGATSYVADANRVDVGWPATPGFRTPDGTTVAPVRYLLGLWDNEAAQMVPGVTGAVPASGADPAGGYRCSLSLLTSLPPSVFPLAGARYQVRLQACANHPLFDSHGVPSAAFAVGMGIGHTRVGINFGVQ